MKNPMKQAALDTHYKNLCQATTQYLVTTWHIHQYSKTGQMSAITCNGGNICINFYDCNSFSIPATSISKHGQFVIIKIATNLPSLSVKFQKPHTGIGLLLYIIDKIVAIVTNKAV